MIKTFDVVRTSNWNDPVQSDFFGDLLAAARQVGDNFEVVVLKVTRAVAREIVLNVDVRDVIRQQRFCSFA